MNSLIKQSLRTSTQSLILCLMLLLGNPAWAAQKVVLVKAWTNLGDKPKTANGVNPAANKPALSVFAHGEEPGVKSKILNEKGPALSKKEFWRFTSIGANEKEEVVKYELETFPAAPGRKNQLFFVVDEIKKDRKYFLRPAGGASLDGLFVSGYTVKNADEFLTKPVSMVGVDDINAYATRNRALEPSIAFKTGKASTASLKLFYGFNHYENQKRTIFKSLLDVEATYRPKDTKNILTKIEGEIDFLYQFNTHLTKVVEVEGKPGEFTIEPSPFLHALVQAGVNSRVETDQTFDAVQGTVGVTSFMAINGSSIQWLGRNLSINAQADYSVPSPVLSLSYELVTSLKEDQTTGLSHRDTTTDRLRAHLWMSHRLVHDWNLKGTWPFNDLYAIDFVIDSGLAYDFRNSTMLPELDLSLEFAPVDPDSKHISFVVTYVNGKTKAKFENYNSILAGFKKAF